MDGQTDEQTVGQTMDDRQSDKLSLSFSSGGLKSTSKSDMFKKTI